MAYRGRILVEMSTKLEGKVDKTVDTIHSDDILVAQVIYNTWRSVVQFNLIVDSWRQGCDKRPFREVCWC